MARVTRHKDMSAAKAAMQAPVIVCGIGNVLDPVSTKTKAARPAGRTARAYALELWPLLPTGRVVNVAVDGEYLGNDDAALATVLKPGQSLTLQVVPKGGGGGGGKNVFSTVSMIALMVAAPAVGSFLGSALLSASPTAFGSLAGMATFMGTNVAGLVGGAFTLGASMLISAFVGTGSVSTAGSAAASVESASPSWSDAPNPVTEGGPWPVPYGTAKMKPVCISWSKQYDGKDQYLNWLGCIADCEVSAIDGIEINGNPLSFYDNVQKEIRLGTLDQAPVSFFKETISEKSVYMKLSADWVTARTDGNACQGLGFILCFDQGLAYIADKGEYASLSVTIQMQYRKVGDALWTDFQTATITDNTGAPLYKLFRAENVDTTGAQFDVRTKFTETPASGTRYRNRCYLVGIQEIVYDEFCYPGRALLGLRIKANDLINTSTQITVECVVTRSTVQVFNGTAWVAKDASNPAWAAWDFQHNQNYGGATPASRIVYDAFEAWANWLATKPLYRVNLCMDSISTHQSWMEQIAMLGRGAVVPLGSKFTCIVDRPEPLPANRLLFNVGNIRKNSFSEKFLSTEERANCIEVTYKDKDSGYSEQTLSWYGESFNTSPEVTKSTQVKLLGCTSTEQALKEAEYRLKKNRYLTNTVTFGASVEAIGNIPGDVIAVGHDVPQWGFGGRVEGATANVTVGIATTSTVTLDREVTMEPGTSYALQVRLADDTFLEYPVKAVTATTTTDTLTIVDGWDLDGQPEKFDPYQFGPVGLVSKLFRILSIQRTSDFTYGLACLEHNEGVYDDTVTVPAVVNVSSLQGVTGLVAAENLLIEGSTPTSSVALSWRGVGLSWAVSYRKQGAAAFTPRAVVYAPSHVVYGLTPGTVYEFRVAAGNEVQTITHTFVGIPCPPDVTGFTATASSAGLGTYRWGQTEFLLLQGYELRYAAKREDGTLDWASATVLTAVTKGTLVTNAALPPGDWTVGVKAVGLGGRESVNAAVSHIKMGNANTVVAQAIQETAWPGIATNMVRHHTGVLIPLSTKTAAELGLRVFTEFAPEPVAVCSYESPEIDLGTDVSAARLWATAKAVIGPGVTGSADPHLEVDYRTAGGAYGGWRPWSMGVVPARYVKMRVVMDPTTGAATLNEFTPTVDIEPKVMSFGPIAIPAGGGAVAFPEPFYAAPRVYPQALGGALYAVPSSITPAGCTVNVYNSAGASVGGTVTGEARLG